MYLNKIKFIFVILIIINLNYQVFARRQAKNKGKKVSGQDRKVSRNERSVPVDLVMMEKLCQEFCEIRKNKECKIMSKYKIYNIEKKLCTCSDKDGMLLDSKIYKADEPSQYSPKKDWKNFKIVSKISLHCNESETFPQSCNNYCKNFVKADNFSCAKKGTLCVCYNTISKRMKRQMLSETILDDGTEVVGMRITPKQTRRAQHYGHRPPMGPMGPMGPVGHMPMPIPHQGCNPYTCMNQCPYGCDSLCRQNQECYCSCPEDLTYEYYDDSLFGSLFG